MAETGKTICLTGEESVEVREYDVLDPDPGEVRCTVVRANVCGSELHIWRGHHPEIDAGPMGHEALCRVDELGEGVETDYAGNPIEEGDLVAPVYFLTCQTCSRCQDGDFHQCKNAYEWLGKPSEEPPHFHGTFSTHYFIHENQYFYKVPEDLPASIAAGANCALSQIMFGIDEVDVDYDENVVVQGAGGLGLNSIAYANEKGANTIVVEGVDGRIERAREFGVDHVVDFREYDSVEARAERVQELTDGNGADVAIEVTGVPDAFAEGVHLLRDGGRYLEMGNISPGHFTEFDPGLLTRKSIDITARVRYEPWYLQKALRFMADHMGEYPYADLLDAEFDLVDVNEALEKSDSREITRATLIPHEHEK